jgi:hypothetical protein
MELTIKEKALIRCRLDDNNEYECSDCEIKEKYVCDYGANYEELAKELLIKFDIKWNNENQ